MKFKTEFKWLTKKNTIVMLYAEGMTINDGGLFKGQWSPHTGGGFGGVGIPETQFREVVVAGWFAEEWLEKNEAPDMIGFRHTAEAMRKWPFAEVIDSLTPPT